MADAVEQLRGFLAESRRAVVFTGAGISTESGIPDFRSPGGVWDKFKPVMYQDFVASDAAKREYWRQRFSREGAMLKAEPNRGHRAVETKQRARRIPLPPERMAILEAREIKLRPAIPLPKHMQRAPIQPGARFG